MDNYSIVDNLAQCLKTTKAQVTTAAVGILLKSTDLGFKILFVKRAESSDDPWSGQIAFPGGKHNPEDRNMKEAVVRETLEETGINLLEGCRFLGIMEPLKSIQRPEMRIIPFVVLQEKEQNIKLNKELTGYFWTPLKDLVHNMGSISFRSDEFSTFIIGRNVIWGLTFKIVHNLLSLLSDIEKSKTSN